MSLTAGALRRSTLTVALVLGLGGQAWAGPATDQLRTYTDRVMVVLESRTMTAPERHLVDRQLGCELAGQIAGESVAVSSP